MGVEALSDSPHNELLRHMKELPPALTIFPSSYRCTLSFLSFYITPYTKALEAFTSCKGLRLTPCVAVLTWLFSLLPLIICVGPVLVVAEDQAHLEETTSKCLMMAEKHIPFWKQISTPGDGHECGWGEIL
jgi:hypothetical protein